MAWRFGVSDLAGVFVGEATNAHDKQLQLPLNGLPTASFRLRLDDPLADAISTRNGDCLVKVYDGSTLRFIGDVVTVEEVGGVDGQSIQVNAAGPLWRLQKRLVGTPYPSAASSYTNTAANLIIDALINQANTNSETGIQLGTRDTLYATSVGTDTSLAFKPTAELIAEMQASKVPFPIDGPTAWVAFDSFVSPGVHTALSGRADDLGKVWSGVGDAEDFYMNGSLGYAYRGATPQITAFDVSGYKGRWMIAGTTSPDATPGPILVGHDYRLAPVYGSGNFFYIGPFARHNGLSPLTGTNGDDAWVWAYANLEANSIALDLKLPNQVPVTLATYTFPSGGLGGGSLYRIRLLVDDDGNYTVWHYASGQPLDEPKIIGSHAALASTGALATGKVGFHNAITLWGATASNVDVDAFLATTYTGPQSFDFEIAPIEYAAGKIGTLNVRTQIGSAKPNAVFEYGTGSRSVKSYKRTTDRNGLLNVAYVLPTDFTAGTTPAGEIRTKTDFDSITARGAFQEVIPSDIQDTQLRQALADAHVRIRSTPRQLITFEPSETAPVFGTDYIVGDTITARAVVNGQVRFNATSRVYGVEINVDPEGKASIIPTLVVE